MKYFKLNAIVRYFLLVLLSSCTNLPVYQSENKADATLPPSPSYDKDSKLLYQVEHDQEYLYLTLATSELSIQDRIIMGGLTVWLDQKGKKNEDVGFRYPVLDRQKENADNMPRMRPQEGKSLANSTELSQKLFNRFKENTSYIELIGFAGEGTVQRFDHDLEHTPVDVHMDMDSAGQLTYVARIPLDKMFRDKEYQDGTLSIGIQAIGFVRPGGRGPGVVGMGGFGSGPGPGGRMGGRMGGGARGEGRASNGPGPDFSTPAEIDFWFAVDLSPRE